MDDFSDRSWKLIFLLGLPRGATVVLSDAGDEKLRVGLQRHGCSVSSLVSTSEAELAKADAVLILPGTQCSLGILESALAHVSDTAQVLAFFKHRWNVFSGPRAAARHLLDQDACVMSSAEDSLRKAGFGQLRFWLPLPKLGRAEEFVSRVEPDEIAASFARTRNWWSSCRARLHDGFGVYATAKFSGMAQLESSLERVLADQGLRTRLRITRFDLRERGALILFIADEAGARSLVCRVVRGSAAVEHLQRHWDLQDAFRGATRSSSWLQGLIPENVAMAQIHEHQCWIEQRIAGTVSWRLLDGHRVRIDRELVEFLAEVARATGNVRVVEEQDLQREAMLWRDQIGDRLPDDVQVALASLLELLRARLLGQVACFGWVHGDYGYGNALALPENGRVCSVIDWETASADSFVGSDLYNFFLQRARATGCSMESAMQQLVNAVGRGELNSALPGSDEYLAAFVPQTTIRLMVIGVTLIRWMLREHRYVLTRPVDVADLLKAISVFMAAASVAK